MSKINSVRIINLNYNNNAYRIDDEIFDLNGESTLLSLRNGGGKSVLVQMMIAPFVNKRYRDTRDREFSSYFTTNNPTYILVEWTLDNNSGYFLTGMMVRKKQESSDEDSKDKLDIINFTHEYKKRNEYDIYNIKLVENSLNSKKILSFSQALEMFSQLKSNSNIKFNYYDMNNSTHSRNYFSILKENDIDNKEWEGIIKKINLKESGLSELFIDAKNVNGLIEKWFLNTIEKKLNQDENRLDRFVDLTVKFIKQYKENESKFEKKAIIEKYKQEAVLIEDSAEIFKETVEKIKNSENEIANFYSYITSEIDSLNEEKMVLLSDIEDLCSRISQVRYDEISYDIYSIMDRISGQEYIENQINEDIENIEHEKDKIQRLLNILECAKIYEEYAELSKECQKYESELNVLKNKDKDLTPRRNSLGYTLKLHYDKEYDKKSNLKKEIENKQTELSNALVELEGKEKEKSNLCDRINQDIGVLKNMVSSFDIVESEFNSTYKENMNRNIVGLYKDDALAELSEKNNILITKANKRKSEKIVYREELIKSKYENTRKLEEYNKKLTEQKFELNSKSDLLLTYEQEISQRKELIKLVNLSEDKLFFKEHIIGEFDKKIELLNIAKTELDILLSDEEDKYNKLKTGKVLELPKEFEEKLNNAGVNYAYGMQWLKSNGNMFEYNSDLVANNPFIPYSIVLTRNDIKRIKSENLDIFTSFPIPIVCREVLAEKINAEASNIVEFGNVSFYIAFNNMLLDEDGLAKLLSEKQLLIDKLSLEIKSKKSDIKLYTDKRSIIEFQSVNEDAYKSCIEKIETLKDSIYNLDNEILNLRDSLTTNEIELNDTIEEINKLTKDLELYDAKKQAINLFEEKYQQYVNNKNKLSLKEGEKEDLVKEIESIKSDSAFKNSEKNNLDLSKKDIEIEINKILKLKNIYNSYTEAEIIKRDIEDIEAEYESITKEISQDQKNIEELLKASKTKFDKKEEYLIVKQNEYKLSDEDFKYKAYDMYEESSCKLNLKTIDAKFKKLYEDLTNVKSEIKRLEHEKNAKFKTLNLECGEQILRSREDIILINFGQEITKLKQIVNEKHRKNEEIEKYINKYENHKSSMEEYKNLVVTKKIELDNISYSNVDKTRAEFINSYKSLKEEESKNRYNLQTTIAKCLRDKSFEDEFFKTSLEKLESISSNPFDVIESLHMTLDAYQTMLEKLEVDINIIEEEKLKVLDILMKYVLEVHENLGKIDKNSSIKIRDKNIKMLKIILPDVDENIEMYKLRLRDFLDVLIKECLEKLSENKNIEELVSTRINTKNLYDEVVSISNIDIKLYKIEQEREYQISWDEVAKNSGGEGFLSAFVVLSSLLSYLRRSDTDIFFEKESGKVLVMDNPFAQTNAEHLLKPLMDIAKKNNTQLICLSGLSGESIYNIFDNIYVLDLVSSSLRNGKSYIKSEHKKGEDQVREIVSSQFAIEQIKLF